MNNLPEIPADLAGWRWAAAPGGDIALQHPEGLHTTRGYAQPTRAITAARKWRDQQPADTLSPEMRAHAEDVLEQAKAFIGRAQTAQQAVNELGAGPPATAWQPGPHTGGVYRRPPDMPERQQLAPRLLLDGRWQPRTAYPQEALDELTDSVREHGVLEELLALINEAGEVELITGHRRKRAAIAAELLTVPVKILEVTLAQATEIAIISNDQRSDLTDLERGQAYEKMIAELGISEAELARRLSRPRAYIQQRRMIAGAAPALQRAIASGELGFTQARAICLGSGGDHEVQTKIAVSALKDLQAGRTVRAEDVQRQAEGAVRDRAESALKKLGWKMTRAWSGNTPHVYWFASTAAPAEWSPAEILTAVKEARRPPAEKPKIPSLSKDDVAALERRGWRTDTSFSPWPAISLGDAQGYVFGDQAVAAAEKARADVEQLLARFQAAGWTTSWRYGSTLVVKLAKPKREETCHGFETALKLIGQIEKGKLPPARESSGGYTYAPVCDVCRHKNSEHKHLDGKTVCVNCAPPIEAKLAQERALIAQALEAQGVPTWLATAPAFVADLLLVSHFREWMEPVLNINRGYMEAEQVDQHVQALTAAQRQQALRALAEGMAWSQRPTATARHLSPATAVAPPAETPAAAVPPRDLAALDDSLDRIEERWAAGGMGPADADTLEALAEALDAQLGAGEITTEEYEPRADRISGLLRRLLEQGVTS